MWTTGLGLLVLRCAGAWWTLAGEVMAAFIWWPISMDGHIGGRIWQARRREGRLGVASVGTARFGTLSMVRGVVYICSGHHNPWWQVFAGPAHVMGNANGEIS